MDGQGGERATKIDVAPGHFAGAVVGESQRRLVVVDFWAPWCGPCRTLGPLLEKLAVQAGGRWLLAKVNVDHDQAVASEYGVQGIPAVKAFKDGRVVDEFVGAIPEAQLKAFLKKLLPTPADEAYARAAELMARGEKHAAHERALAALERDGRHAQSLLLLAELELGEGKVAEAVARLGLLLPADLEKHAAAVARLRLAASRPTGGELAALRARAEAHPDDAEAQMAFARGLLASGDAAQALERFFSLVEKHRREGPGEQARLAMLEAFEAIGSRSELAEEYRTKLSRELYR
jgi:putative thioredoxin